MRRLSTRLTAIAVAVIAFLPAIGGGLEPPVAEPDLDGLDPDRVFPDPLIAGDFIQYTPGPSPTPYSYLEGLAELERRYGAGSDHPMLEVAEICDLVCDSLSDAELAQLREGGFVVEDGDGLPRAITSVGGRAIPVVTLTAPDSPDNPVDERVDLYFSMSIHGNERAGLEGSLRYIEDLATAYVTEREGGEPKVLRAGEDRPDNTEYAEYTVVETLERSRLVFVDLNPDGWVDGDRNGGRRLYKRGNDNGIDLNRQWPTLGWHNSAGARYHTGSEPEALAGRALIEGHLGTPEGAADLHGENNDNVLLAIMFPAGQFDQIQLQGQYRLAEAIKYNVNHSVHPGAAGLLTDITDSPVYPAEYHTAYDAIGYDDSGFQGDYLVQRGILEMDHEYAFSNLVPSSVFVPELEQIHVDTTRALLDATIAVTLAAYDDDGVVFTADLGGRDIGYVFDPELITHHDVQKPPPFGLQQHPYAATNMRWFEDLAPHLDDASSITPLDREQLATTDLSDMETIVVADDALAAAAASTWEALGDWAQAGGTLVLTDQALEGLEAMDLVADGSVERIAQYAGSINDVDRDHPLLDGVGGIIGQSYFEVPLGHRMGTAPAWVVASDAWQGSTAATAGGDPVLGTLAVGDGRVTIFGVILPDASNAGPNTHGLADYAVTYAGNGILLNALRGR